MARSFASPRGVPTGISATGTSAVMGSPPSRRNAASIKARSTAGPSRVSVDDSASADAAAGRRGHTVHLGPRRLLLQGAAPDLGADDALPARQERPGERRDFARVALDLKIMNELAEVDPLLFVELKDDVLKKLMSVQTSCRRHYPSEWAQALTPVARDTDILEDVDVPLEMCLSRVIRGEAGFIEAFHLPIVGRNATLTY